VFKNCKTCPWYKGTIDILGRTKVTSKVLDIQKYHNIVILVLVSGKLFKQEKSIGEIFKKRDKVLFQMFLF